LSEIDVELITNNIRKEIKKKKLESECLLNFIADELSKSDIQNKNDVLNMIIDDIDVKYSTKQEVKTILQNKIEDLVKSKISPYDALMEQIDLPSSENILYSGQISNSRSYVNLRQLINRLEKNKDLTNLMDGVLHFGKHHMSFAKRIFFLQITQNYLSAIKYMTINDLITRQTLFNSATEDAIKNMINLINDLSKQTETSTIELKNYAKASEQWIHNNEHKLSELESQFMKSEQWIHNNEHKLSELESQFMKSEQWIHNNEHKLNDTNIIIMYNIVLKRNPAPWEHDLWMNLLRSGVPITEITNKLRIPEEFTPLIKNYLVQRNISFETDKIAYKKFGDFVLYFDINDHIIVEQFLQEYYEKSTTILLSKVVKKGMTVVNIGANMGYFTLLLSKLVGNKGKVFAFEPFLNNVKFIEKNVRSNNCNNVEIIPKAISQKSGKTKLWLKGSGSWNFISTKELERLDHVQIETTSIDEFFKENQNVDFVMMDAEGSEKFILDGMTKTIENNPKLQIITEYNPYILELAGSSGKEFLDKIEEMGFLIHLINEEISEIEPITKEVLLKQITYPKYTNLYLVRSK
jgi:FkbM family methyltransferase